MAAGFRILPLPSRRTAEEMEAFRQCAAARLADSMGHLHAAGAAMVPQRGIAGFVVDGAIRGLDFIGAGTMPVYSTGVSPRGPSRAGPGDINGSVTIAGMVVSPGDIIVGDADGVVAVPRADAVQVLAAAQALRQKEEAALVAISRRELDRTWIDAARSRM